MGKAEKIYFLGPEGSYTQIAAEKFFPDCEKEAVSTITRVIREADAHQGAWAVVPIENSIEGIVRETIDNLLCVNNELKILSQLTLPIQHCLVGAGEVSDIKQIISHPQALSQCQGYISENFPKDIDVVFANSTSHATSLLDNNDKTRASIANEFCAQIYGMKVIEKNINDVKDNKTRFVLLGYGSAASQERTSIAFSTKNKPGALMEVLEVFKRHGLNMIYIESRPSRKIFGEYTFFVDIDCGADKIAPALSEVRALCDFYRLLGSYSTL